MISNVKLTQQMKKHAVINALKAEHSYLKIAWFLKIARCYIRKFSKELETTDKDSSAVVKCKGC